MKFDMNDLKQWLETVQAASVVQAVRQVPVNDTAFAQLPIAGPTSAFVPQQNTTFVVPQQRTNETHRVSPSPTNNVPPIKASSNNNKRNAKWLASFAKLQVYKQREGHCMVPRGYDPDPQLASWVAQQRKQYKLFQENKSSNITPERIDLLDSVNFEWNAQEAAWARHLEDLRAYKQEHGNCLVPMNHSQYPKLAMWIKEQRRHYALLQQGKPTHMTPQRASILEQLDFCWDTYKENWSIRFQQLLDYKRRHGDCLVPISYPQEPKLATWVHHQRRQYNKYKNGKPCHITLERIRSLEGIGFVWDARRKRAAAAAASQPRRKRARAA